MRTAPYRAYLRRKFGITNDKRFRKVKPMLDQLELCADDCARRLLLGVSEQFEEGEGPRIDAIAHRLIKGQGEKFVKAEPKPERVPVSVDKMLELAGRIGGKVAA